MAIKRCILYSLGGTFFVKNLLKKRHQSLSKSVHFFIKRPKSRGFLGLINKMGGISRVLSTQNTSFFKRKISLSFLVPTFSILLFFLAAPFSSPIEALPVIPKDSLILDDEVEIGFQELFSDLLKASSRQKATFQPKIFLVANPSVNAASGAGGQFVIFSGLFRMCTDVEEFLGVVAHELAHGRGVHSVQAAVSQEKAFSTAAIAFALGGIAALAAKDASPFIAGAAGGQSMYYGSSMYAMQNLEKAADAEAVKTLERAHIPAIGLLSFLEKIYKEYGTPDIKPYFLDHPLTEERIQAVKADLNIINKENFEQLKRRPWAKKERYQKIFDRIRTKIIAFTDNPHHVLRDFKGQTTNDHYARAVAYGRIPSQTQQGLLELNKALTSEPHNPYFLELKSQLLMDKGNANQAIEVLSQAVKQQPKAIYLKMSLAHLMIEKKHNIKEAIAYLQQVLTLQKESDFAWHLLGKAYTLNNQEGHALWANAEKDALRGDKNAVKVKLRMARAKAINDPILLRKINDLEKSL